MYLIIIYFRSFLSWYTTIKIIQERYPCLPPVEAVRLHRPLSTWFFVRKKTLKITVNKNIQFTCILLRISTFSYFRSKLNIYLVPQRMHLFVKRCILIYKSSIQNVYGIIASMGNNLGSFIQIFEKHPASARISQVFSWTHVRCHKRRQFFPM